MQAGLEEFLLDPVEEGGVAAVRQLRLDLGPLGGALAAVEALGANPVDADLGEQGARGVEQMVDVAGGPQTYDGNELGVPDAGAHQGGEVVGHRVGEGAWISSRTSSATGSFRCQPSSSPPMRRRRVMEWAASRWSAVSK
ncbi:hypothetical protein SAV31267_036540 [Streptomyces avermitilis]|uniref:Uncharacterized protein n=1 Tax=Streptomyces avermitilis TaxID=33903 RepID=A0A4D4MS09_STRAX|nr:hypothetical protein SAV31267_036540 [Streptomyces avermitilis]